MTVTKDDVKTEVLTEIGDFVGCARLEKEAEHDFGRRILMHIKERAELLAETHAELLHMLGEDGIEAANIKTELLDYDVTFTVPPWEREGGS
jgi:hypothetical protein